MTAKICLLPIVPTDLLAGFRETVINWSEKRPIDVSFAGLVDYEVRGTDYWDGKLAEALAIAPWDAAALVNNHRRAAVLQLGKLRHLRVLIGINRALQPDLYLPAMLRSSISISPWGFGEYAYRDYELILAGCILIKPLTDHVETFAPDIYQSGKYYLACKPDFSDLTSVVDRIMADRTRAVEFAHNARDDLLRANRPDRIYSYFLALFREALGLDAGHGNDAVRSIGTPDTFRLGLRTVPSYPVRAEIYRSGARRRPPAVEQ